MVALVVLAVLVFGPEKLPKVVQDVTRFIRKVRTFSESAKDDIRRELGPEFKDFEFEDLNPRTFLRKNILENDDIGLKELKNGFDLREELSAAKDVRDWATDADGDSGESASSTGAVEPGAVDLRKKGRTEPGDRPPFDADAT